VVERFGGESPERALADYVAGMTDRFALAEHERFFGGDVRP
jgi:dGTP triphosphohydrolase